jgi:hypothetical protein
MALYKELDPELHLKMIEGYKDELTPELHKMELFYRTKGRCKRCGCALRKEFNGRTAFSGDTILPKALLRCDNCGFLLEPFTDLILDTGSAAKIPVDFSPHLDDD